MVKQDWSWASRGTVQWEDTRRSPWVACEWSFRTTWPTGDGQAPTAWVSQRSR